MPDPPLYPPVERSAVTALPALPSIIPSASADDTAEAAVQRSGTRPVRVRALATADPTALGVSGAAPSRGAEASGPRQDGERSGMWPKPVHDQLVAHALQGVCDEDVTALQQASARLDLWSQLNGMSYVHAMKAPGESNEQAKRQADLWVKYGMQNAVTLEQAGAHDAAMGSLAGAMHTVMDATSPAHRDAQGDPKTWDMWSPSGIRAHKAEESGEPSPAAVAQMDRQLRGMYDQVMGGRSCGR